MEPQLRPMSPVDAAWYHIDGPVNLAQVTGIVLTRTPLDFPRVRKVYERRLLRFERFRQKVVEAGFPIPTPHWVDDPSFDLDQHLRQVALPSPCSKAALTSFISDLASRPLDPARPLWDIHVVDNVDGGSALVMRFHHCIGDGTAMMAVTQQLFDVSPDAPVEEPPAPAAPHPEAGLLDRLLRPAIDAMDWGAQALLGTVQAGLEAARHPGQLLEQAGTAAAAAGMLIGELLKPSDPVSPLKGPFGLQKRVAWSEPVPLLDVKAIGATIGAKVNDVLVAGLTGALRAYLRTRGVAVDGTTLRAMVPVDLRPRDRALELGNDFGLVILDLAIECEDPLERLVRTKANMDVLKQSPEAVAIKTLFNIFGRGPKVVEDLAVDLFSSKASLVLTNVAGPRDVLHLAGTAIDRMMFWVPHPGRQLGMGVSILSYAGAVTLAVVTDAHLIPDPEVITDQFNAEFQRLRALMNE